MSLLAVVLFAAAAQKPPAYTADIVSTYEGKTTRSKTRSDGVITKTENEDGKSGTYTDAAKHVMWVYGPGFPCTQVPIDTAEIKAATHEEVVGNEAIDGHPTKKLKVTTTMTTVRVVEYQWRATDLHDLVIRRSSVDGKSQSHLDHIVVGAVDAKRLTFPAPPCKVDEAQLAASTPNPSTMPQAPGGSRTIKLSDGVCKPIRPLPIAMSIPSDYAVKSEQRAHGCFFGTNDDLSRVISSSGVDFTAIRRGVFWCRVSENTAYDPVSKHFVSDVGKDTEWSASMRSMGAKNVAMTPKMVGVFPSLNVTASVQGQRVYMLYLAIPNTDSLAILINYHPAGKGAAADDAAWNRFVESLQMVK